MTKRLFRAACASLMTAGLCTGAGTVQAALTAGPAMARQDGFVPIGDFAEYRIDGVRQGTFEGASVRFLDMTLRNMSDINTFLGTIQEVSWQGRTSGSEVRALKRDLTPFGTFDQTVSPGQAVSVTYVIPRRDDIAGVTVDWPRAASGLRRRVFRWEELGAGPSTALVNAGMNYLEPGDQIRARLLFRDTRSFEPVQLRLKEPVRSQTANTYPLR